ncbi:MAG: amidohydrolase [Clostridia bacterium]|nr:amidohydrolase [Clostridia bacterium]
MNWEHELEALMPDVLAFRRDLHRHPELSGHEERTRDVIERELQALGIETHRFDGCCSLMGVLRNGPGRCVAIRADMDALPVTEQSGLPFSSENPGVMHACGHDMHMALSMGSAMWFSRNRDRWHGTVKWLFESEEETVGGGQRMVAQGCMQNPRVDCVIGQHMNPAYPVGTFYSRSGAVSGCSDELTLTVRGTSCHGAYPQRGVDAIVVTAGIVTALQTLVSRSVSAFDPVVLTFGTIRGGTAQNIICGEVTLDGTLRTITPESRRLMHEKARQMVSGIAEAMGASAELVITPSYSAVVNDAICYEKVEACAREIFGDAGIVIQQAPSLGVESFCYFLKETPGVYWDLGSGVGTGLHTPTFNADESVLLPGVAMQCASTLSLLDEEASPCT